MSFKIFAIISLLIASSCASKKQTLYDWHDYQNISHKYHNNSLNLAELEEKMTVVLLESENKGRVPPGMYAEYGYILLELGKFDEAIKYFDKESKIWPESKKFMTAVIKRVSLQKKSK